MTISLSLSGGCRALASSSVINFDDGYRPEKEVFWSCAELASVALIDSSPVSAALPELDIFLRSGENDALWLESVNKHSRMEQIRNPEQPILDHSSLPSTTLLIFGG